MIRAFCDKCGASIPMEGYKGKYKIIIRPDNEKSSPVINAVVCETCEDTIVKFIGDLKQ